MWQKVQLCSIQRASHRRIIQALIGRMYQFMDLKMLCPKSGTIKLNILNSIVHHADIFQMKIV